MLDAAKKEKLRVLFAHDTFLGCGIHTSRKLLDDGVIGKPVAFTAFMLGSLRSQVLLHSGRRPGAGFVSTWERTRTSPRLPLAEARQLPHIPATIIRKSALRAPAFAASLAAKETECLISPTRNAPPA